jgi:phospho-N-acetylmuramoyl-pentapeptide-transferase
MFLVGLRGIFVTCVAILFGIFLIPFLRKLKAGQFIRQEGPQSHLVKAGTPTMGGFIFVLPWLVGVLMFIGINQQTVALAFGMLFFGVIGFIDDYIKVVLKRNLGLRAYQKIIGQLVGSALLIYMVGLDETLVHIPVINSYIDLGWVYYPFALFFIVAVTNSVNLTDGLDGLASFVTLFFLVFTGLVALSLANWIVAWSNGMLVFALSGFIYFNKYPAKVFMGDIGSLALGGYLAAMIMLLKVHFLFLLIGFIYVAEAASVVIQVFWFKRTGKRIFKMAPLHHHFELLGWNEIKIVSVFTGITAMFGLVGYWIMR